TFFSSPRASVFLDLHSLPTRRSSDLSATDTAEVFSAIPCAAASRPSAGSIRETSPPARASSASKTRPVATHSIAWEIPTTRGRRSEEHTSELQSRENLVCRLLLEKKN